MIIQISKNRLHRFFFYYFLTASALFVFLWLILTFLLFLKITINFSSALFGISTILIFTHVLYGGYFLLKRENQIDVSVFFLESLIYICLVFLVYNIVYPVLWFFWVQVMFLCAMVFHSYYKSKLTQVYLKEFCNYKLYIEIYGIILCFLGMLFHAFFPSHTAILGTLSLIFVVGLNNAIFRKKRLYSIYYQPPNISETPFVSIVIIAYNEEQYIGKVLESIASQDYPKYEVIIVDDHSTDRTVEIAKSFESRLSLNIVQKDIRGASRSRNYGSSFAVGEVILFLDADAVVALARIDDSNHAKAVKLQKLINGNAIKIYTSNFVVGEVVTVLSQRSGIDIAVKVGEQMMAGDITIICISKEQMENALQKFSKQTSKNSRFTDMANMVLMDGFNVDTIFSFDNHYPQNGYKLLGIK